ncbi:membrane protein insertion efficiency factor YidD [Chloroflexota bacterium]
MTRFAERFILTYQLRVSPRLGAQCRFEPTCSNYALYAYRKYGFCKATAKTLWRLMRCNPFNRGGGVDWP